MKNKRIVLLFFLIIIQTACSFNVPNKTNCYTYSFFGPFDTVTQITAYAKTQDEFNGFKVFVENRMTELHNQFDIYNNYEGINNIKTINDNAGIESVVVNREILELITTSIDWYERSEGTVNIALGPVLKIWHEFREAYNAGGNSVTLPSYEELKEAYGLCSVSDIIVDAEKSSVYLTKEKMSLDVGSTAKGMAVQMIADEYDKTENPIKNYLINAGGNVVTKGQPLDGKREKWGIGIQDPIGADDYEQHIIGALYVHDCAVVTSGDYQRNFVLNGKIMGHIISPETLMPANLYHSVTIIGSDSGIADILSTALFILPYEEGLKMANENNVEAVWVFFDGTIKKTDGAEIVME